MAINGTLKILVLKIISNGEKRGSEILNEIENKLGWRVSPGSFYPLIHELFRLNFVSLKKGSSLKIYVITKKGENFLKNIEKKKEEVRKTLKESIGFLKMLGEEKGFFDLDKFGNECYQYLPLHGVLDEFFSYLKKVNIKDNQKEIKKVLNEATKKLKEIK